MGAETGIAWTDHTHNEWIGCLKISAACASCYAEVSTPTRVLRAKGLEVWGPASTTARHRTSEANRRKPFAWNRAAKRDGVRRKVFCSSLSDVFEDHPMLAPWRADLWRTIEACDGLDWQLLTKRPENILAMVPESWRAAWPAHVWIGTTVEDQRRAEERIPHLLAVPARVRFLSCEPLLEEVDLSEWIEPQSHCGRCTESLSGIVNDPCPACGIGDLITTWGRAQAERWKTGERYEDTEQGERDRADGCGISWVIVGGESGPGARPFDLAWARSIVRQCREAGVAVFCKQIGAHAVEIEEVCPAGGGCGLDECSMGCRYKRAEVQRWTTCDRAGADPSEWPTDLRVQEFPEVSRG